MKIALSMTASTAALVAGLAFAGPAAAQTKIVMSNWLPPQHPIVKGMLQPWADKVKENSGGKVTVEILPPEPGAGPKQLDMAKNGVVDASFSVHGYQPGRFVLTKIGELPQLGNSAAVTGVAFNRTYNKFFLKANEHDGVELLSLVTHGPGYIWMRNKPVNMPSDLNGVKMRIGGGLIQDVAKSMGAVLVAQPATKAFELLSTGVADGTFFPAESIQGFKLLDYIKYGTKVDGGLYNTSFYLVMNPGKYKELSPEAKAAVDKASGDNFSSYAGDAWDAADRSSLEAMQKAGIQITEVKGDALKAFLEAAKPAEAAFNKEAKEKGYDGEAALKFMREEIAKLQKK